MQSRSADYDAIRVQLAQGRRITVLDVMELTGRDAGQANILLNNLLTREEVVVVGKEGRRSVYAGTPALADMSLAMEIPRSSAPDPEALRLLLAAFRIGPAPSAVPRASVRIIRGRYSDNATPDDEA